MKRIFFVTVLVLSSLIAWAQDVIVCKDNRRIDAVITEVSDTEVKYRKKGNANGPIFILNKSDIHTIIFSDGDVWTNNQPVVQVVQTTTTQTQPTQQQIVQTTATQEPTQTTTTATQPKEKKFKLQFNPTPTGEKHIFGVTLGYTSKSLVYEGYKQGWTALDEDKSYSPAMVLGFTATPEFKYGIGIQTGLYYELCRNYMKESFGGYGSYKLSVTDHAFVIPVRMQYRYEIITDLSVFLYTGPEFEIGLAYVLSESETVEGDTEKEKFDYYKESEGYYKRFRAYWGLGAGVQWKYLQLRLGGTWGLNSVMGDYGIKLNKPFNICVSYLF